MPSVLLPSLALLLLPQSSTTKKTQYPFDSIAAFGDDFSDNGNGSYAHGLAGTTANYGFGTWTDGPVAISYLADLLDLPLRDLAWGGSDGGAKFGATVSNAYTPSESMWNGTYVPSVYNQIHDNYTASNPRFKSTLHFIWTGHNDLMEHADWFWLTDPRNANFTIHLVDYIVAEAEMLAALGATYVMVANIYPKQLAPVTKTYLCPDGSCVDTFGRIIQDTNSVLEKTLKRSKFYKNFIYYDAFAYMMEVMEHKDSYGLTAPLNYLCDGGGHKNWTDCTSGDITWNGAKKYYWMNYIQPTTTVHKLIANDMKHTIDSFLNIV